MDSLIRALPAHHNLFEVCIDQYGYYSPETLKVVKAYAEAQKHAHNQINLAKTEKLANDIEQGLKMGKHGGHPSFSADVQVK
jgi:hypothetical protein